MHATTIRMGMATMLAAGSLRAVASEPKGLAIPVNHEQEAVSPLLDDAGLNDVQVMGDSVAWAAGDRGVLWKSADGGRQWEYVPLPVECSLRSVCFLTNLVGWIVGGGVRNHGSENFGVVLQTTDGGETWQQLGTGSLPLLHQVQFFDLNEGVAVGEANGIFPTGVLATSDGGKTWQPVIGTASDGWRCAAFMDTTDGFVAGRLGQYASVSAGQVRPAPVGARGLRSITDAAIGSDRRGWYVGDGGLLLQTETGGQSWHLPQGGVPNELRDVMDFRAVATAGNDVWLAGQPGSVIWHSADGGATWTAQATGNPLPLQALAFASRTHGCAVGALGRILTTIDGGTTWDTVRGANRRTALLAVHAHESHVSLNLATKYGRELGYRMAACVMARRDVGPDGDDGRTLDLRLHEAVTKAGGVAAAVDWSFPIAAPGLEHDQAELVREWTLLTDNRLREKMLNRLTSLLCTWRPDVVIIDQAAEDDAATKLLGDALRLAIQQAADPQQMVDVRRELQLPVWKVKRQFSRQQPDSQGSIRMEAYEYLPRLGKALTLAAAEPYKLLGDGGSQATMGRNETYLAVNIRDASGAPASEIRDLFAGLTLAPGGEARRSLDPIDDESMERRQALAQQQRNFAAYAERMLDDPRQAAQLIGQTKDITAGAPPDQAAVQLFDLAGAYRRRGEWEHAQAILAELVERYPREPAAAEARSWLLSFWISAEVGWQRLRSSSGVESTRTTVDGGIVRANFERAIKETRAAAANGTDAGESTDAPSSIRRASAGGLVRVGGSLEQHAAKQQAWLSSAERLVDAMHAAAPAETDPVERQFLIAALSRKQDRPRRADDVYRRFLNEAAAGPWNQIAAGEIWLLQPDILAARPTAVCRRAATPPLLDGFLDDACWRNAFEVQLRNEAEHRQSPRPFIDEQPAADRAGVMWAYDAAFLYVAARVPRNAALPRDKPQFPGRTDDADLSRHDRLVFALDTDRDYTTFYEISVDQRGWTADACWENRAWNCRRFIAEDADDGARRVEMAIPFQEIVPQSPRSGEAWAVGISRVLPTIGVESWTHPGGSTPRPEGFGLLRFE